MWVNLQIGILEEFAERSADGHANRDFAYRLRTVEPKEAPDAWALQRERTMKRRRLLRARVEVASARPPCPQCLGPVERLGTTGTPPKFCSHKCMQAAKFARWAAKNRPAKTDARDAQKEAA